MAPGNHFWTEEETRFMIDQVQRLNVANFVNGRKTRNAHLFNKIAKEMARAGFARTSEQIRIKWKSIRQAYNGVKHDSAASAQDRLAWPYYKLLDDLLGRRPLSQAAQRGLDVAFEAEDQEEATEMESETTTTDMKEETTEIKVETTETEGLDDTTATQQRLDDSSCPTESLRSTESSRSRSPPQRNSESPGTSGQKSQQRRRAHTADVALICQKMAETRDFWRAQQRQSDERQEQLLNKMMEGSNSMVAALLESIRSLRPAPPSCHPHPVKSSPQQDALPGPSNPTCDTQNPVGLPAAAESMEQEKESPGDIQIKMDPDMDSQLRIGFIGAGNMAFGIAKGIMSGNVLPSNIKVSAPSSRNLGRFQESGIGVTHSNVEVVSGSDVVFVAVKPHLVPVVLGEVAPHVTERHIIVSVAAGVTLATLEELLPDGSAVLRLMPNLPCVVQEGALVFARGSHAKPEDGALLRSLLQRCGLVEEGPEAWIDVHTGLSGSGVAFVYLFAEALAEGAVKMGLPGALAHSIAAQTVLGAGRLLRDSGKHPAQLRSEVCTPGGTTIYGLHTLEQGGVRAAAMSAVEKATERARELGRKSSTAAARK